MAEQTHIKNKTEQEKYFERLQEEDAYKILDHLFYSGLIRDDDVWTSRIFTFLKTGILEGQYVRK